MIIQFLPADLEHVGGYYYSPPFLVNKSDTTIQISTSSISIASIEASVDGVDYFELPDTSFTTSASGGIQSYSDAQDSLYYKIKIDNLPVMIKILV